MKLNKELILLGDIVNYSIKGLMAAFGKGGNSITNKVLPISFRVDKNTKFDDFIRTVVSTKILEKGDIIVIPSKIIALLEKRFVYGLTIENYHKCVSDFKFVRKQLKTVDRDPFTKKDQIGLDKIDPKQKLGIRYPKDPNFSAFKIANAVKNYSKIKIDVVISDSDAGGKKGEVLIGCPTIISTPIGATKGLGLFYCMRVSNAAEATWNNVENIPIVIIKPYQASRFRKGIGELRYREFLNAKKEKDVKNILKRKQSPLYESLML